MTPLDTTKETLSAMAGAGANLRGVIPTRLITVTFGVFGAGLALGAVMGALGYRAFSRNNLNKERTRYETWTKSKLEDLAADIEARSEMSKDELIDVIRAAS